MQARPYRSLVICWVGLALKSMGNLTVFTNNGIVVEYFETSTADLTIKWISATISEVLGAAKNAVSKGAKLYSSPLTGVKSTSKLMLNFGKHSSKSRISSVNPYLSLLVGPPGKTMDFESARLIDDAQKVYKKSGMLRFVTYDDDEILKFQTADLETLLATVQYASHLV